MKNQLKKTGIIGFTIAILCGVVFTVSLMAYQEYAVIPEGSPPAKEMPSKGLATPIEQHTLFILLCIGLVGFIGVRRRIDPGYASGRERRRQSPVVKDAKVNSCQLN